MKYTNLEMYAHASIAILTRSLSMACTVTKTSRSVKEYARHPCFLLDVKFQSGDCNECDLFDRN
jgi:hypothetical protein